MKTIPLYELKKIQSTFPCEKITNVDESAKFIKRFFKDDIEIFESVFILLLNNASKTIGYAKISQGGITGSFVDVRIVCKYAIDSLATGVIIAHNHPSGKLIPSESDIYITKRLKEALNIIDVSLLDHLILTYDGHYSLQENGEF
ncbi:JAB domain-containing protein [Flavobacterium sp.]|uniref:JAB domain-containing protein n=1 Tax=Flavobacterium sp. TaxID=239 RepID=UPI0037502CAD